MTPQFRPVAGHALLVSFDLAPDLAHVAVLGLDAALRAQPFPGLVEIVPANINLLVTFDPLQTDPAKIEAHVLALDMSSPEKASPVKASAEKASPGRCHDLPVTYDGPDLAEVATRCGLTPAEVIRLHAGAMFRVWLYGFAPGYAYLGGLPPALRLDRKTAPRRDVPAGSVIIAGGQCLVTTLTMPTGWWIIGHSPARILTGDPARPFLFDVGDSVRFVP